MGFDVIPDPSYLFSIARNIGAYNRQRQQHEDDLRQQEMYFQQNQAMQRQQMEAQRLSEMTRSNQIQQALRAQQLKQQADQYQRTAEDRRNQNQELSRQADQRNTTTSEHNYNLENQGYQRIDLENQRLTANEQARKTVQQQAAAKAQRDAEAYQQKQQAADQQQKLIQKLQSGEQLTPAEQFMLTKKLPPPAPPPKPDMIAAHSQQQMFTLLKERESALTRQLKGLRQSTKNPVTGEVTVKPMKGYEQQAQDNAVHDQLGHLTEVLLHGYAPHATPGSSSPSGYLPKRDTYTPGGGTDTGDYRQPVPGTVPIDQGAPFTPPDQAPPADQPPTDQPPSPDELPGGAPEASLPQQQRQMITAINLRTGQRIMHNGQEWVPLA